MKTACAIVMLLSPVLLIAAPPGPDAKVLRIDGGTTVRLCLDCTPQPLKDLVAATDGEVATTIESARIALDRVWRSARQDLETKRSALRTQLDAWHKLVSLDWAVPPTVVPVVTFARDVAVAVNALDGQGKVGEAKAALAEAQERTASDLNNRGRTWQQASRLFFDDLINTPTGVSDAILAPLRSASDGWRGSIGEIDAAPPSDPAAVQPLLRQIMSEYVTAGDHLRELRRRLRREFDQVASDLHANGAETVRPSM